MPDGGGLAARYLFGPGQIRDMVIRATPYPLEDDMQAELAASARLVLPGEAGLVIAPFHYRSDQPLQLPSANDIQWIVPEIDVSAWRAGWSAESEEASASCSAPRGLHSPVSGHDACQVDQTSKVAVVTGPNAGLGNPTDDADRCGW